MFDDERLQLAGPIGVIAAIACAELGAYGLASWPTSSLLWYLNLEVFRSFHYSLNGIEFAQRSSALVLPTLIAVGLVVLVSAGLLAKVRLPIAIASNISLLYSACLLYGSYAANASAASSRLALSGLLGPSSLLAATILLVSLLSSTVSHRRYWRELFP